MVSAANKNYNNNVDHHKEGDEEESQVVVYGHRISSVGPGRVTGDVIYEGSNMDLAMKLHYLRIVYMLESKAVEGLTTLKIKESVFSWLNYYYESCGRFRRSPETGRPYIKCNDCGIRFVEAYSSKTLEEWLVMMEEEEDTTGTNNAQRLLLPHHVLGPELTFSPLVFLQITSLKCGGMSISVSWAHVLGDAYSVSDFMNTLARFLSGQQPTCPPNRNKSPPPNNNWKPKPMMTSGPLSLKQVGPFGDHWIMPTPCTMDTFSFHVTPTQLSQLQWKLSTTTTTNQVVESPIIIIPPFECVCAVIWWAIAKRAVVGPKPDTVTVIKQDTSSGPIRKDDNDNDMTLRNNQVVISVKAEEAQQPNPSELAKLLRDSAQDERAQIEEMVGRDPGGSDFIVYGSNLTFVNLEEADFYGFELKGFSPKLVNCFVDGIGEEGVVLVLPAGPMKNNIGENGRLVTLILPTSYMAGLKEELRKEWNLIS